MNETLYRWTFNFLKVVRQQKSGAVEDFILPYPEFIYEAKMKELLKSVHICQSYRKNKSGTFFMAPRCRVIGLHFCRCMYGSIFIQLCAVSSKRRIFSASDCVLAVQGRSGSSKVDDFCTNRKCVYDFLLVRHCDYMYGPILHRFWDTVTYWLKIAYFCYIFATPHWFGALAPYVPFGISRWS